MPRSASIPLIAAERAHVGSLLRALETPESLSRPLFSRFDLILAQSVAAGEAAEEAGRARR